MKKILISPECIRNNAFKIASELHKSGFFPTKIYAVMRGGAYMAIPISEYFYRIQDSTEKPFVFGTITARSYISVGKKRAVEIVGWSPALTSIEENDRIIIAEDIVDTGDTLEKILKEIEKLGYDRNKDLQKPICERNLIVVVHDFKVKCLEKFKFVPDIDAQERNIESSEKVFWLHYLTHELIGLEDDEIKGMYGVDIT